MDPQTVGFETWVEVYEYLKGIGFENEARVGFIIPPVIKSAVEFEDGPKVKAMPSEYIMEMVQIRALAFDELYPHLPKASSVQVVQDIFEDIYVLLPNQDVNIIIDFINKIPTKK